MRAAAGAMVVPLAAALSTIAPAGSSVKPSAAFSAFSWHQQWYPIAFSAVTAKDLPQRVELFGEPIALWHTGERWAAMADACPHRLAPLSEGRVDAAGQIECPYHGWTFSATGACTKIPQLGTDGGGAVLARCGGARYATCERQGLVWLWGEPDPPAGAPDEALVPTCGALDDERFVHIDVSRDMPYSADMLLENVLDSSHVPFTHHQTISKRENAVPLPLRLTSKLSAAGFSGEFARDAPVGRVGDANRAAGRATERTTVFRAPAYMHHRIRSSGAPGTPEADDFEAGFETWTVACVRRAKLHNVLSLRASRRGRAGTRRRRAPAAAGSSRASRSASRPRRRARAGSAGGCRARRTCRRRSSAACPTGSTTWASSRCSTTTTSSSRERAAPSARRALRAFTAPLRARARGRSLQERRVADVGGWRGNYVTPTAADAYVNAFRAWFDAAGPPPHAAHAVDHFRSAPLDKAALLDRYSQHTAHCTSCLGALRAARRVAAVCRGALLALAAALPSLLGALRPLRAHVRALCGLGVLAALQALAWRAAAVVAQRLTSGMAEYPPPRNRAEGKGAARELRTVEQGRRG